MHLREMFATITTMVVAFLAEVEFFVLVGMI